MRRRVIDPGFWTDSKIAELSFEARLLYIGLWQYADDEGLFVEDLKSIKMVLFPDQRFPLEKAYGELTAAGFFRFGTVAESALTDDSLSPQTPKIVEIRRFLEHQTINRPTPSKLRGIVTFNEDSLSTHSQVKLSKEKIGDSVSHNESPKSSPNKRSKKLARPGPTPTQLEAFSRFYEAYPRHVARAKALEAWIEINPDAELAETITAGAKQYAAEVQGTERGFIAHPPTWLNGRRWEDEPAPANGAGNGHAKPEIKDLGDGFFEVDGRRMDRQTMERRYGS